MGITVGIATGTVTAIGEGFGWMID